MSVDGQVSGIEVAETEFVDGARRPKAGTEQVIPADLVLIALGFSGPESEIAIGQDKLNTDSKTNLDRADDYSTNIDGVFVAGDAGRGQSLIVWAIAEGRAAASTIDKYLEGTTSLPSPVKASDKGIHA